LRQGPFWTTVWELTRVKGGNGNKSLNGIPIKKSSLKNLKTNLDHCFET